MKHETIIVSRPFDRVRPICTCGWQGATCGSVADAELEAAAHVKAPAAGSIPAARTDSARDGGSFGLLPPAPMVGPGERKGHVMRAQVWRGFPSQSGASVELAARISRAQRLQAERRAAELELRRVLVGRACRRLAEALAGPEGSNGSSRRPW